MNNDSLFADEQPEEVPDAQEAAEASSKHKRASKKTAVESEQVTLRLIASPGKRFRHNGFELTKNPITVEASQADELISAAGTAGLTVEKIKE